MSSNHASPHQGHADEPLTPVLIPGAYERNTLTHRQAGAMSGPAYGSSDQPHGASLLDAATTAAREMEGGGGVSQRPRKINIEPQSATAAVARDAAPQRGRLWLQFWHLLRH